MQVKSERGAMLIMVMICLLALTLLSAFVIDQGIMYASKRQAQNAADAGALSAALHLRDNGTQLTEARSVAKKVANANPVWGQAPADADVIVDLPITCPPGTGGGVGCVRVDVMRGGV